MAAQQRERMPAHRHPQRSVVGDRVLGFRRWRQRHRRLLEGRFGEQRRHRRDAGNLPGRLQPVAGKRLQRVGAGQHLQLMRVELRRAGEGFHGRPG